MKIKVGILQETPNILIDIWNLATPNIVVFYDIVSMTYNIIFFSDLLYSSFGYDTVGDSG